MNRTEMIIIDAFWEILENKPYSKITVKDIVERCQVNRNTFYYHFHDIPELVERVIKQDADQVIQNYGHFDSPMDCLNPLVELMTKRKKAILHIYQSVQREVFLDLLDKLAVYCVNEYINTVTADITVAPQDKKLLVKFYKCALVGVLLDWLDQNMNYDLAKAFKRISVLFKGSILKAYLKSSQIPNS